MANCDDSDSDVESEAGLFMSSDEEEELDQLLCGGDDIFEDDIYQPTDDPDLTQSTDISADSEDQGPVFSWQDGAVEDIVVPKPKFTPSREPGIHLGRITRFGQQCLQRPIDFFKLFFSPTLVLTLCIATNSYAEMKIADGQCKSYASGPGGTWERVTEQEMYRFIGIVLYMSVVKLHSISRYWSSSPMYRHGPNLGISRTRFQAILSFLQITPVADVDKGKKLTRVQPLIDHVTQLSQELFQLSKSISVDEIMLPSKHQFSGIRQFIRDKPIRFGLKLWVVACSVTGYTWDFFVYLGKKGNSLTNRENGVAYGVVMQLCQRLFDQGYWLFVDSFYTSMKLATDLLQRKICLVGTVRSNSSAMPEAFKDWKQWEKVAKRGDFRWIRTGQFAVVQWKDSKVVTALSSVHSGSDITSCERTVLTRTGWQKKKVLQPSIIKDYNKGMGGVDLSNQMSLQYSSYIRSQYHWWKVIFFHCLDICVVNSYILFTESAKKSPTSFNLPSTYGQLEFREALVSSLLSLQDSNPSPLHCVPAYATKKRDCCYCNGKASLEGHQPPSRKTCVFCEGCDVPLCFTSSRNCFRDWHTPAGQGVRRHVNLNRRKRKL